MTNNGHQTVSRRKAVAIKCITLCFVLIGSLMRHVHAFAIHPHHSASILTSAWRDCCSRLSMAPSPNENDGLYNPNRNESIVTKEMFLRKLLEDPHEENDGLLEEDSDSSSVDAVVKRDKRKNGKAKKNQQSSYRVLDNRDSLPFSIKLDTPDPYTHPDIKKKQRKTQKKPRDAVENSLMTSSVFTTNPQSSSKKKRNGKKGTSGSDEDHGTLLGDFQLDKHTTSGDVVQIGDIDYKVLKHRCLYKYAGGKQFVMVRKILHVKPVGRVETEDYLRKTWNLESEEDTDSGSA